MLEIQKISGGDLGTRVEGRGIHVLMILDINLVMMLLNACLGGASS